MNKRYFISLFLLTCLLGCTSPTITDEQIENQKAVDEILALEPDVDNEGRPIPIKLTKEQDDAMVAAGIFPPLDDETE